MPARSPSTSGATGLRREAALYLRLAGMAGGHDDGPTVHALADGVDWDALRRVARRDGTTAAVHRRLDAAGVERPPEIAAGMEREARVLDFHRLVLERSVAGAVAALDAAGIRVALLKGAATARVAYPRPTDRPMSDADLLLAPDEADEAARVLQEHGWTDAAASAARYDAHHHLPPLRAPGAASALVELHRDVLPAGHPFVWGGGEVLERARPNGGAAGLVPDRADLVLHACVHFAWSHELRVGAWRTFADVAALVAVDDRAFAGDAVHGAAGWAATVVRRAAAARATSAVAWTMRLASELAGVRLPPALAELAAGASGGRVLARHLAGELVPGAERAPSVRLSRLLWERALRPERSGHGSVRPWRIGLAGEGGGPIGDGAGPAAGALRRLAAWRRYGRRLLGA